MMEIWSFILSWYNLPFTILLGIGLLMTALQLIGLSGDNESDTDVDHDVDLSHDVDLGHDIDLSHDVDLGHDIDLSHDVNLDHDVDLSHDIDADHDLDVGHDLSHDVDHDVDHAVDHNVEANGPSFITLLAYLGVGKVPLMVVLLMFFDSIGILGWLLNGLIRAVLGVFPGIALIGTLPVAVVGGSVFTSRTARLIGQLLPPISTTASRAQAFVGKRGIVISPFVDHKYGMVHMRDAGGTLISIFVITEDQDPIKRGEEVLLLSYDVARKLYLVSRTEALLQPRPEL